MQLALLRLAPLRLGAGSLEPAGFAGYWRASDVAGIEAALDEILRLHNVRLVIDGELADLALALTRLMRRGVLDRLDTAVLPRSPVRYLRALGLPTDRGAQLEVARSAPTRLVGVIKDDSGGLCLDSALLTPWTPSGRWWVRAVVDDQRLCDGGVRSLTVRRVGPDELVASVSIGRLRRRTCRGRSLQLACDDAQIVADGVGRQRPRGKRTFWSEPKLWRLALPEGS